MYEIKNNKVFYDKRTIVDTVAKDFVIITPEIGVDKNNVFLYGDKTQLDLEAKNVKKIFGNVITDGVSVFASYEKIDVDPSTYERLGGFYTRDKNGVYYQHEKIEGADLETFVHVEDTYCAKDKNNCYSNGKVLEEVVDIETEICDSRYVNTILIKK